MTQIFLTKAEYGLNVTYEWGNKIAESFTGVDYCNAQWLHPITKINFNQAWFDQARYDYIVNFYYLVNGNQDIFLVEDPLDNAVTRTPLNNKGLITQGIVIQVGSDLQLFKQYKIGGNYINRPITRPHSVRLFNSSGVEKTGFVIDPDTGIIVSGGNDGDTWTGNFRLPMRFENDSLPMELQAYDELDNIATYSLPDLRMTEEKEGLVKVTQNLLPSYEHYFQLPIPIGTQYDTKTKTDIYSSESGYSARDSLNTYRMNVSMPEITLLTQTDVNYLVGLQRLLLGDYGNFKYLDSDASIDNRFRLLNPLSFTTVVDELGDRLFNVSQINFVQDDTFTKSTYCYVWRIIRKDNEQLWFTNHDQVLGITLNSIDYLVYPQESPTATSASKTIDIKTDSTEITSIFGVQVTEADLLDQKYNYAELQVMLFDWATSAIISRLFTGSLGGHTVGYLPYKAKQYQFEAVSLVEKLESSRNVQTSSQCRHKFLSIGYGNCNLTPLGREDPLYMFSSCNKTIGACQSYGNIVNFGGQPRLPGVDETVSRPE